jgi:hypothetical protein
MNIDVKILIFRPTIVNASEPLPVFIPHTQPVPLPPPERRLTLASLCRAIFALAFWYWVIVLCLRLI